jgi:DNA-binding FrmR family transcriptional regulator
MKVANNINSCKQVVNNIDSCKKVVNNINSYKKAVNNINSCKNVVNNINSCNDAMTTIIGKFVIATRKFTSFVLIKGEIYVIFIELCMAVLTILKGK